jgi:hypothetical protein
MCRSTPCELAERSREVFSAMLIMLLYPLPRRSPDHALEVEEAEVWFEYRQASREPNRPDCMGFKGGAKSWHKRALALNRPYTQIILLHRQRTFGMVCDG